MTTPDRDKHLTKVLQKLAEKELQQKDIIYYSKYLERIFYLNENELYRTPYSTVYKIISLIDKGQLENCTNENLITNIKLVLDNYTVNEHDVKPSLSKLADHINLDISRLLYTKELIFNGDEYTSSKTSSLENRLEKFDLKISEIKSEYRNMQNQYISILGIFAAIILAFVGSMTFSTSVLQNMKDVSIYRLIAVGIIIGWVFFTLIWTLLYFITTLVKNETNKKSFIKIFLLITAIFAFGFCITLDFKFNHPLFSLILKNN